MGKYLKLFANEILSALSVMRVPFVLVFSIFPAISSSVSRERASLGSLSAVGLDVCGSWNEK